jgi:predicted transcriptional regulator/uncharacterized membrane protein
MGQPGPFRKSLFLDRRVRASLIVLAIGMVLLVLVSASATASDDDGDGEAWGTIEYRDSSYDDSLVVVSDSASFSLYTHWGGELQHSGVKFSVEPLPDGWTFSVDDSSPTTRSCWVPDEGMHDITINIDQDTEPGTYYMEPRLQHPKQDITLASLPLFVEVTSYKMTLSNTFVSVSTAFPGERLETMLGILADAPVDRVARLQVLWAPTGWEVTFHPGVTQIQKDTGTSEPLLATITPDGTALPGEYKVILGPGTDDPRAIGIPFELTIDVGVTRGLALLATASTLHPEIGGKATGEIVVENQGNVPARIISIGPIVNYDTPEGWVVSTGRLPITIPPFTQTVLRIGVELPKDPIMSPAGLTRMSLRIQTGHPDEELPFTIEVLVPEIRDIELGIPMTADPRSSVPPTKDPFEYTANIMVIDEGNIGPLHRVDLTTSFELPITSAELSQRTLMMTSGMSTEVRLDVKVHPKAFPGVYTVVVNATDDTGEEAWILIGFSVSSANVSLVGDLSIVHIEDSDGDSDSDNLYLVEGTVYNADLFDLDYAEVAVYSLSTKSVTPGEDEAQYLGSVPIENVRSLDTSAFAFTYTADTEDHYLRVQLDVPGAALTDPDATHLEERVEGIPTNVPGAEGMPVFFIMAAAVGAIAGIIAILGTEAGRWMLMAFILIPMYTRLKPEQVTNHFVRGQILGYVKANPGETYTHIRKALNISNGQFVYHSRILESQDFIKSVKDGANRRFYPEGMRIPKEVKDVELNQVQRIIYTIILEYPGISQSRIAKMMELAPSTVNYHVNIMTKVGVVERKRSGRLSLCFAAQELD